MKRAVVSLRWDDLAGVWIATGVTVPGLVLEDDDLRSLFVRVKMAVPDLLDGEKCDIIYTVNDKSAEKLPVGE